METRNLGKSLKQIFQTNYIIPLYQRNFAWGVEEISQLLYDLYEAFSRNNEGHYHIGSLVVLQRNDNHLEVIDGQQRLTTLTLLGRLLGADFISESKLFYESRPEVESFFQSFYATGSAENISRTSKTSHLVNAVDTIMKTPVNASEIKAVTIGDLKENAAFKTFFANNVILVRVEIPADTDVAAYFEIMNNRGEQLQKHEILKARLMDKIKGEDQKGQQQLFAQIWDACSQMDVPIQKLFKKEDREKYFGLEYDSFHAIAQSVNDDQNSNCDAEQEEKWTIDKILELGVQTVEHLPENTEYKDVEVEGNDKSIIDFPNFLMHVLKLHYASVFKNKEGQPAEIPLNENELIEVYEGVKENIKPMEFIHQLFRCRTIFDRYVVRSAADDNSEENYRWALLRPQAYEYNGTKSLRFKNTFEDSEHERIVKSLSLLQVSFRNRRYKNWLQDLLSWFKEGEFEISASSFQEKLDKWITNYFSDTIGRVAPEEGGNYNLDDPRFNKGTQTPHFLFNFIDYLYWVNGEIGNSTSFNFDFKYRNSVEHHLPQSFPCEVKDHLGNLCLVSKSANSRMNNEAPRGKADTNGKYYRVDLPPKQKVMYDLTNQEGNWSLEEIKQHHSDVLQLLQNAEEILRLMDRREGIVNEATEQEMQMA